MCGFFQIGSARMTAVYVFVIEEIIPHIFQALRQLAGMARMHPVVLGGGINIRHRIIHIRAKIVIRRNGAQKRAFRFVFYAAWIARRWEDPAFPAAFPHFGTPSYWEDETRDLEEHVDLILRGGDDLPPGLRREETPQDVELTNKDFFWDLE